MIKPGDLENREATWQDIRGEADVQAAVARVKGPKRSPEERLAAARSLLPPEDCDATIWTAGRDAAIRVLAGE